MKKKIEISANDNDIFLDILNDYVEVPNTILYNIFIRVSNRRKIYGEI